MARFNLNGFLDNSRFEDFFARFTGGSADRGVLRLQPQQVGDTDLRLPVHQ
jgi:hypothetical protein